MSAERTSVSSLASTIHEATNTHTRRHSKPTPAGRGPSSSWRRTTMHGPGQGSIAGSSRASKATRADRGGLRRSSRRKTHGLGQGSMAGLSGYCFTMGLATWTQARLRHKKWRVSTPIGPYFKKKNSVTQRVYGGRPRVGPTYNNNHFQALSKSCSQLNCSRDA
jgi:hypothetical protein